MKLLRYGPPGQERPGLLDAKGIIRALSDHVPDVTGAVLSPDQLAQLAALDPESLPAIEGSVRLGPPVGGIGKMMCIGLNYRDHAAETGSALPDFPMLFMKATSAIIGANDQVILPRGSTTTDWEVELAVVIGQAAKYVSKEDALSYVAGYTIANDVSERTFQKKMSGQFTKGKSCDTFGPLGPWLVTADEIPDPQNLKITLDLDGERMQDGHTSDMIFTVAEIISHLSQCFTLHPGDVLITGTPAGVGAGIKPEPRFLTPGDVMLLQIEGLGEARQEVAQDL
ncbi:MAG: fumarylacetoacetate hydrolase family protein [Mangrovicoccus sp.]